MSTHVCIGDKFTAQFTLLPCQFVMLPVVVLVALLRVLVRAHALLVLKTSRRWIMFGGLAIIHILHVAHLQLCLFKILFAIIYILHFFAHTIIVAQIFINWLSEQDNTRGGFLDILMRFWPGLVLELSGGHYWLPLHLGHQPLDANIVP